MRILSQKVLGEIDLPYESIGISIKDKTSIIAYPVMGVFDDGFWELAIYSTEAKARKAMKLLQNVYYESELSKIQPNGAFLTTHFQFPQDSEIEV